MLSLEQVEMKLYSLGYGGKACYFDLSSDGEPRYLASSSTNSNEDEDGSCWLGFGFEKGTDIYVAHEQTKLPGGEITSGLGTVEGAIPMLKKKIYFFWSSIKRAHELSA